MFSARTTAGYPLAARLPSAVRRGPCQPPIPRTKPCGAAPSGSARSAAALPLPRRSSASTGMSAGPEGLERARALLQTGRCPPTRPTVGGCRRDVCVVTDMDAYPDCMPRGAALALAGGPHRITWSGLSCWYGPNRAQPAGSRCIASNFHLSGGSLPAGVSSTAARKVASPRFIARVISIAAPAGMPR